MKLTSQLRLTRLCFREIRPEDFALIAKYVSLTNSRTCDYTLGGIVIWSRLFSYRIAEADDTLFIRGGREDDLSVTAFSLPLGGSEFTDSIATLREAAGGDLWFSAIPEDCLHLFASLPGGVSVGELGARWSDYLYDIRPLASLEGGAMKKKRNHVNRFMADHADARLEELTEANAPLCIDLLHRLGHDSTATGIAEFEAVDSMLRRWADYAPYFRGRLLMAGGNIAGFTVGEIVHDTLHVHVEKADHTISGANEALTSMFAAAMLRDFPALAYANRQDDAGDPGLRASKLSWAPLRLLPKFNVHLRQS